VNSFTPASSTKSIAKPLTITYRDFSALAGRRNWTPESLAEKFKGKIENPSEFFHRIMSGKYPNVIIPYRSVISFYGEHSQPQVYCAERQRVCACGCGEPVFDRKKWATPGCKKRIARQRFSKHKDGVSQVPDLPNAKPGQRARWLLKPLAIVRARTSGVLNG
jgi:hypothetical protein